MANMNWSQYNKKLIKRGEILLDFTTLKNWKKELKKMNKNKRGKPYKYPNTLITLIALIRILYHLPYRETQGFIKALTKHIKELR
ncbi:MAG: transposase, partial [Thermoprotei archaeon]